MTTFSPRHRREPAPARLWPMEQRVVALTAAGFVPSEIAYALGMADRCRPSHTLSQATIRLGYRGQEPLVIDWLRRYFPVQP
jgi:hypothetical protein